MSPRERPLPLRSAPPSAAAAEPAVLRLENAMHFAARLDRLVDRVDELEAAAPFEAVDEVALVVGDAVDHVLVVRLVAEPVDVRRVDRVALDHVGVARL